ncbi:TetR/AcrR family transcriptional regulator [Nocardiopsis sp. NRRL B-16309]|uniref:TetR/AcrR family transcriptional regulator n=1 Tax=Nocardiopsis sp. NRRL B-16309 TaxID=1519494 RepID=UPI0006AE1E32|nr:TetR family transcriptional regulator [Nocardiopsis sp. NRRL B-16309]KOX17002.1 TetR family transcriptional regulator [Nocardiopsis sp. NRRL B-16309]
MSATSTEAPVGGLRERKKAQLHDALLDTALRLFHEHGYQATTTEEIAARVGVSQRTFFRYFPAKEDILLEALEGVDQYLFDALRERPADEPPLLALRNALSDQWDRVERASMILRGGAAKLMKQNPELMATHMRYCHVRQKKLAAVVAERVGVDPATDPRPDLAAAVFFAAVNTGVSAWVAADADFDDLPRVCLEQLDLLPEVLGDDWCAQG